MNENNIEQQPQPQSRVFNPNDHMMQIKSGQSSKDYLPVQYRLVWFRTAFPHGTIETEMLHLDMDRETEEEAYAWNAEKRRSEKVIKQAKGFCVFRAVVKDGVGGVAVGTKSEKAASFGDFIEKAETGAIGRALAALGYGTQFTGDEWEEAHRIVDSPVERPAATSTQPAERPSAPSSQPATTAPKPISDEHPGGITDEQKKAIRNLSNQAGFDVPATLDTMTFYQAKGEIQRLNKLTKSSQRAS